MTTLLILLAWLNKKYFTMMLIKGEWLQHTSLLWTMSKIKTQVTSVDTVETLSTNSLVGRAAIVISHTRVSLPRRRSWGFVTLFCPTGTRDGPIRTSAWEATREWHAPDTRDGGREDLPPSRVSGAPRWLRTCLRLPEKRDKTLFELLDNRDHFCKRSAPVFRPFSRFPGPRESAEAGACGW